MSRGRRRRWVNSHPSVGSCERCGEAEDKGPMIWVRGKPYHRACYMSEKE